MTTYVVGDIQACFSGLDNLLKKVNFCSSKDQLIAVGDLIGRGPQAIETLHFLKSLGKNFQAVLGNHDLHFLAIYAQIQKAKTNDKFDKLLADLQIDSYIYWLRQMPLALAFNNNTLISHAGLYPQWSFAKALTYSAEISEQLKGKKWQSLLLNMYGNEPNNWKNTLKNNERRRFIVNAFTRMRYLNKDYALNFTEKSSPELAPKQLKPWFEMTNKHMNNGQRVIFGHWASLQGKTNHNQFVGLDTGYLWGHSMTLLNLNTNKKYTIRNQEK